MKRITCIAFLSIMMLIIIGCSQSPEEAFKEAEKLNTIYSYEKFLEKYADSNLAKKVQNNLEKLRFNEAKNTQNIEGYEDFMKIYPNSQYLNQVKDEIEKLKWVGKTVLFKKKITIQGSTDSWLVNVFAKDLMKSNYIATYKAVVEDVIGDSVKIVINDYKVNILAKNGMTSIAQHTDLGHANDVAARNVGKIFVIKKSETEPQK